jgi:hypothetical protein
MTTVGRSLIALVLLSGAAAVATPGGPAEIPASPEQGGPREQPSTAATIGADTSEADPGAFRATREGDLSLVRVGDERYEIPDAVVLGG